MDIVAVMPAFEPKDSLPGYVRQLADALAAPVVVVDDGSSVSRKAVFDKVAAMPGCRVLRHDVNRGKGVALKTALACVAREFPETAGVIAVDADGQHSIEDCRRLADAMLKGPRALYLGVRRFSLGSTPFRSWWGNRWTTLFFALLFQRWISDTQTGLRAFRREEIPFLLEIPGERYEYEMAMLAHSVRADLPIEMLPIRTIYDDGGGQSHFSPLIDTFRIYKALLSARFGRRVSSVSSPCISTH
ncbi:MAG: glycosyltransferase family 2 protein [Kiritimatiellae bacterium]|nr:glycosyltransferase family 2 protein [Kiritimatiellia bacterium]